MQHIPQLIPESIQIIQAVISSYRKVCKINIKYTEHKDKCIHAYMHFASADESVVPGSSRMSAWVSSRFFCFHPAPRSMAVQVD